jgi:hypothetical protein
MNTELLQAIATARELHKMAAPAPMGWGQKAIDMATQPLPGGHILEKLLLLPPGGMPAVGAARLLGRPIKDFLRSSAGLSKLNQELWKLALDPGLQKNLALGFATAALPQAYTALRAPSGHRGQAMMDAAKWTALGAVPGLVSGNPLAAASSGLGLGLTGGERSIGSQKEEATQRRTRALIDEMSKKLVSERTRRKLEEQYGSQS